MALHTEGAARPDAAGALTIRDARLLDHEETVDLRIAGGRITQIAATLPADDMPELHADGGLVTPAFVEPHFHPDKALTFPRVGSVGGTSLVASMERGAAIKRAFTVEDVEARAIAALELAVAYGIGAMRAQVDVDSVSRLTCLDGLLRAKERFAGRIDLQLVAFPQEGIVRDPGAVDLLREALGRGADILGGGPDNEASPAHHGEHLETLFRLAREFDVPLDVHIDLGEDPDQRTLAMLAELTVAHDWVGRVTASHCCALAAYPDDIASEVITAVRDAGIQICICPMGNLQLVGDGRPPRGRGASRPKELLDGGVNVAAGSDNLHDMWFRFGRLDPVELGLITCLAAGMRSDAEVREAFAMVTTRAARYLSLPADGVVEGAPGDLVVFSARSLEDVLRNAPGSRTTVKGGRVVGGAESRVWLSE